MSVSMIALLGQSPPVVTEGIRYIKNCENGAFRDVIVLSTRDNFVRAGVKLIEASMKIHYPSIHLHKVELDTEDILTEEDNFKMMKILIDVVKRERNEYGVRKIYLNVAGGRKISSISASLFGSLVGITKILHIIHRDIQTFNELLERHRRDIVEFLQKDDIVEYYRSKQDVFDSILYPSPEKLHYLDIPVIPYPPDSLERLIRILQGLYFDEEFVPDFVLERYKEAELIVYDRTRTYPTELGEKILEILR